MYTACNAGNLAIRTARNWENGTCEGGRQPVQDHLLQCDGRQFAREVAWRVGEGSYNVVQISK